METLTLEDFGMSKFLIKIKKREEIAKGTVAFYFEKPAGFEYKAGQFVDMALLNAPQNDEEGNVRSFSLASAPFETYLMIATRMRGSSFKRWLKEMPLENEVKISGPFGNFTLHQAQRPAVFLAGGIGITPFRSIVLQATHEQDPHKIFLFYSNRKPEDAPFLEEMQKVKNRNYTFIGTMTEVEKASKEWAGERGYINKAMLAKYIHDLAAPIYYIAGPPAMVSAMHKMLVEAGVSEDDIRIEEFAGY